MIEFVPLAGAALLAGLFGSAHCLAMCAGISGMISINAGVRALSTQLPLAIAYNLGRVASYALLGAVVAGFGDIAVAALPALAGPIRFVTGAIIVLIGLQLAFDLRLLAPVERAGLGLWKRIAPLARPLVPVVSVPRALALGLLWGFIPCGLVYSVLLLAATSANPAGGAMTMLAFGIGTMPAMVATGVGAYSLSRITGNRRRAVGLLIVVLGLATLALPVAKLMGPDTGAHAGHSMP